MSQNNNNNNNNNNDKIKDSSIASRVNFLIMCGHHDADSPVDPS
jgi:hypothetical protein